MLENPHPVLTPILIMSASSFSVAALLNSKANPATNRPLTASNRPSEL